jgi:hypothetical protein
MKSFSFLMVVLMSLSGFAITEARWSSGPFDLEKKTYVVVAGEGFDNMGSQFTKAALAQVRKIQEFDPQAQVSLLIATGKDNVPSGKTVAAWNPDAKVTEDNNLMTGTKLLRVLLTYQSIAGLYVYSHSTPAQGLALQSNYERFSSDIANMSSLRSHFTSDAVIGFMGCNTGYTMAPQFSKLWNVPIMGALTSTNFQQLHSNGNFYSNDPGLYPSGDWSSNNAVSYARSVSCPGEECLRMKTDNVPYSGIWGTFGAGLGFYKWFCPSVDSARCLQAMKTGALLWLGPVNLGTAPSRGQVMSFIGDFFCPEDKSFSEHSDCVQGINNALQSHDDYYSDFSGTNLRCSFSGCEFNVHSSTKPTLTFVINPNPGTEKNSTMMTEVHSYLKAFSLE